jgi:TonB family protein
MWNTFVFAPFADLPPGLGYGQQTPNLPRGLGSDPSRARLVRPQPDRFGVYWIGGEVAAPTLMYSEPADYSEAMLESDAEGTVLVTAVLGIDGIPTGTDVLVPFLRPFDSAAVNATNRLRFEPATLNGIRVPVRIFVEVAFPMGKGAALPRVLLPGDPIEPPVALFASRPLYPRRARMQRQRGTVVISFIVNPDGLPADLHLIRSAHKDLDDSAMRAVRGFRFKPAVMAGRPVPAHITMDVTYRLYY